MLGICYCVDFCLSCVVFCLFRRGEMVSHVLSFCVVAVFLIDWGGFWIVENCGLCGECYWMFLGGSVDVGESFEVGMVCEVCEEIGLMICDVEFVFVHCVGVVRVQIYLVYDFV